MGVDAKHRFIVLTGPDCAGKSTLAAMLSQYYEVPVKKGLRIKDREELISEVVGTMGDAIAHRNEKQTILMDRWQFPDDIIYERIHGRSESPLDELLPEICSHSWDAGLLLLHVTAVPDVLLNRLRTRGDEEVDATMLIDIRNAYIGFFTQVDLPVRMLDTSYTTKVVALNQAVKLIEEFYSLSRRS